jgi:hypothetical protein
VDVLPIVDVSDTTMAASGTTKKITSNQILGAGGTATLASATITGDLTVATSVLKVDSANTRVGINTTTINGGPFNVKISSAIDAKFVVQDGFTTGNVRLAAVDNAYTAYKIMDYSALSHAWYNSGSTAMTLNSTGLGVGVTPSLWNSNYKAIDVGENGTIAGRAGSSNTVDIASNGFRNTSGDWVYKLATSNTSCRYQFDGSTGSHIWYTGSAGTAGNTITGFSSALMTLDASGNLIWSPASSPPSLATNGQLTVNATSNTNLRFSYRGSDGVTRVANLTLA